jgi:hypothetical protein
MAKIYKMSLSIAAMQQCNLSKKKSKQILELLRRQRLQMDELFCIEFGTKENTFGKDAFVARMSKYIYGLLRTQESQP